jgi:phosphonate transport system substrate-binding protein
MMTMMRLALAPNWRATGRRVKFLASLASLALAVGACSKPVSKPQEGKVSAPTFDPDNRPDFPQTLTFGIVPQQAADTIKKNWAPLAKQLSELIGSEILVKTATTIPEFERRVAAGHYDLSYMNPYHYTVFSQSPGYKAFARQKDKRIKGIVVVRKDSPVTSLADCAGFKAAFPSPAAFAASLLTRAKFKALGVPIDTRYVNSHDSVYAGVAKGIHAVGGGVKRTFAATPEAVSSQLRVLWTTPGFTPHAFAYHPRLPPDIVKKLKSAIAETAKLPGDTKIFKRIKFKGLMPASDGDWDDVRALGLTDLAHLQTETKKTP